MRSARHLAGPVLGTAVALATFALFLSANGPSGTPVRGSGCVQPDPAKRAIRGGMLFDFGLMGKDTTKEQARASIDARLHKESDDMASMYDYTCPQNACIATKIGSYETVPSSYALEPMAGGGYKAAQGSVVGFFVTLRCDPAR